MIALKGILIGISGIVIQTETTFLSGKLKKTVSTADVVKVEWIIRQGSTMLLKWIA